MDDRRTTNGARLGALLQNSRITQQKNSFEKIKLFCCVSPLHNDPMKYGYARVSTDGQSVDAQVRQLKAAGCKTVLREVASGAKTDRAHLRRLLDQLEAGDVVTVTRLDRLARSTRDLLNTLGTIADRKAGFRSLADAWADTTTSHGRLMLTVLGGLADDAECAVMQSDPTGTQESPGLRRRSAPHNLRPQRGLSVRAALPSWPVAVWTDAISTCKSI
jgi:Resolvase, N terminal domain